jgi:hypothetical protein
MRTWTYFEVSFHGKVRLETLSKTESENYARLLWNQMENVGPTPTIDKYQRSEKDQSR